MGRSVQRVVFGFWISEGLQFRPPGSKLKGHFMSTNSLIPSNWIDWIAENQALGVPPVEIADVLAANGFDPGVAWNPIEPAVPDQEMPVSGTSSLMSGKLEALMGVYSRLWRQCRGAQTVDRIGGLSGDVFYRWYYSANRPAVLLDGMTNWPALDRWTPDYMRDRYGEEVVEVMTGRSGDPRYEINCEHHKTSMPLHQYVDLVQSAAVTNDFYMVANNHSLDTSGLVTLLDDIRFFDEVLDPSDAAGKVFLWFGPAGTVTPTHHDTMNVLLAQVLGRKLVTLIPSFETPLVYNHVGVYSEVDCESPDYERYPLFRNVTRLQVLLEPGQALFIPVGWWHHVRSLDISISVSFTNFLVPNDYAWEANGYR
jgi:hypothetical protein